MDNVEREKQFKRQLECVWTRRQWKTYKEAENATGVDRVTLFRIRTGPMPTRGKVIEWAEGIGESVNRWLELAGYDLIPEELVADPGHRKVKVDDAILSLPAETALTEEDIEAIREILEHGAEALKERSREKRSA